MIEELKPYEALRLSGDPWLGEIPKHWSQKRLWSMSSPRVERNPGNLPLLSVFLDRGVIPYGEGGGQVHAPSLDLSNYQVVHPGDFVLNNQQAWRGSVGVSRYHGIISPAYIVLRLNGELLPAYANCLFRCPRLVDQFVAASKGVGDIQRQVFWPFLRRVTVPIPSTTEQEAIVRFLGHANRRIDEFIRAKKKLIALLNEQKQAIIHRAVTRGLDTSVKLKDSGVPWLGEIPAHWNVLRSKYLFREVDSRSLRGEEIHLSMSQRQGLVPSSSLTARRFMSDSYAGGKLCEAGDLVLNRLKAHLGVFALAPQAGVISPDYTVLRPIAAMAPKYFEAVYRTPACRVVLRQKAKGIVQGFWRLYTDDFYDIAVPVPPAEEQEAIVDGLAQRLVGVQMALGQAEREIALMSEYRTRLVADVVTGQLDVRTAAAGLPVVEPEAALTESEGDETDIEDGEAA